MRYYMHQGPAAFRFELAGDLQAPDAAILAQEWQAASPVMRSRILIIDLSFVTGIDQAVRRLFRRWYLEGAQFAAGSERSRELTGSITGRPFTPGVAACADVSALVLVQVDGSWRPGLTGIGPEKILAAIRPRKHPIKRKEAAQMRVVPSPPPAARPRLDVDLIRAVLASKSCKIAVIQHSSMAPPVDREQLDGRAGMDSAVVDCGDVDLLIT